ncbi:MAG TPA: hypothetical protein VM491_09020 [Burkholderiaceae bacterium]|nr:hypothetical protein [Burkholderiaceae bacterium]
MTLRPLRLVVAGALVWQLHGAHALAAAPPGPDSAGAMLERLGPLLKRLRDPFVPPQSHSPSVIATTPDTVAAPPAPVEPAPPPLPPKLRAVVLAGPRSLANLDGTVAEIGATVDGWRLVEVREREAVLVRDGRTHVVSIDHGAAGDPARRPQ